MGWPGAAPTAWPAPRRPHGFEGDDMNADRVRLLPVAAFALSFLGCGQDTGMATRAGDRDDAPRTAQRPEVLLPAPGERPGSPSNPKGLSDTSPAIPGRDKQPEASK